VTPAPESAQMVLLRTLGTAGTLKVKALDHLNLLFN
jgi:hypothetical protein